MMNNFKGEFAKEEQNCSGQIHRQSLSGGCGFWHRPRQGGRCRTRIRHEDDRQEVSTQAVTLERHAVCECDLQVNRQIFLRLR
jgi:hypothetical protein